MNSAMKKDLETVVNAIVNEETEVAKEAFHSYLRAKTQAILLGEKEEDEDESEEKEEDEDDKKPAFLKKKKEKKEEKEEDDE